MVDVIPYLASSGGQGNSNFQVLKESVGIKLHILPYVNTKSKDNASYSAKFLYGKFLSFVDDDDYAGASLTKKYLRTGKYKCRDMKDNK